MTLSKLEHATLLIAAGGLGAKIATGVTILGIEAWKWALFGGLIVAAGSWVQRAGWKS